MKGKDADMKAKVRPGVASGRSDQSGIVSMMVVMIMMLVISLVVLGFAQVSRREQRQTLDRQLGEQAFFAAESGVNDTRTKIKGILAGNGTVPDKTSCLDDGNYNKKTLDTTNNVAYTCILVSTTGTQIAGDLTNLGSAKVETLDSDTGMVNLSINWKAADGVSTSNVSSACSGAPLPAAAFPASTAGGWTCPYGVLRVDLVPTDSLSLSRAALATNQKTFFLYPVKGIGVPTPNLGSLNGAVQPMACTTTDCNIKITNIGGKTSYGLRLSAIYADGTFTISADDGTNPVTLKHSQITIDSTGKAQDVLRRIQVKIPYSQSADVPDYAVASGSSICKRFALTGTELIIPQINNQDRNNPMCNAMASSPPDDGKFDRGPTDPGPGNGGNGGGSTSPAPGWFATFHIITAPSGVQACRWYWDYDRYPNYVPGDKHFTQINDPAQCQPGTDKSFDYSLIQSTPACTSYTVHLQFITTSGIVDASNDVPLTRPYSKNGYPVDPPCS